MRIPAAAAGERQAWDSADVNAGGRSRLDPELPARVAAVRAAVNAGMAEAAIVKRRTEMVPRMRVAASTAKPGSGSAILARPTGVRGESSTATGATRQAAATPMTPARITPGQAS